MTTSGQQARPVYRRPAVIATVAVIVAAAAVTIVILATRGDEIIAPPYRDSAATGAIGLCDAQGNAIRSGSTTGGPVARLMVGATAAAGAYAAEGRTATLYAFQPRAGVDPSEWSGKQLTASSRYTNPRHPMAAATPADSSLQSFLAAYPARDSGFVQLRLYLGAPDQPTATSYDATDIRVTGTSWRVARGGDLDCTTGKATSLEVDLRPTASPSPSR